MKLQERDREILSDQVEEAKDFFSRIRGLMFKKEWKKMRDFITPCNSIHTCFMNFPIDALFIGKDNRVVHLIQETTLAIFIDNFKSVHVLDKRWCHKNIKLKLRYSGV